MTGCDSAAARVVVAAEDFGVREYLLLDRTSSLSGKFRIRICFRVSSAACG